MRHWYLLICGIERPPPIRSEKSQGGMSFVAWGGPPADMSLTAKDRRKKFWLGLAEAMPLVGGSAMGVWADLWLPSWVWLVAGCTLCAGSCWLLRHQTPL